MKIQSVDLIHHKGLKDDFWLVKRLTDSTRFNPGDILDKETVDELCASERWKVSITGKK